MKPKLDVLSFASAVTLRDIDTNRQQQNSKALELQGAKRQTLIDVLLNINININITAIDKIELLYSSHIPFKKSNMIFFTCFFIKIFIVYHY